MYKYVFTGCVPDRRCVGDRNDVFIYTYVSIYTLVCIYIHMCTCIHMCTSATCILYTMLTIHMCIQVAFLTCDVLVVVTTESLASTRLYSRLLSWAQVIYLKMSRDT